MTSTNPALGGGMVFLNRDVPLFTIWEKDKSPSLVSFSQNSPVIVFVVIGFIFDFSDGRVFNKPYTGVISWSVLNRSRPSRHREDLHFFFWSVGNPLILGVHKSYWPQTGRKQYKYEQVWSEWAIGCCIYTHLPLKWICSSVAISAQEYDKGNDKSEGLPNWDNGYRRNSKLKPWLTCSREYWTNEHSHF